MIVVIKEGANSRADQCRCADSLVPADWPDKLHRVPCFIWLMLDGIGAQHGAVQSSPAYSTEDQPASISTASAEPRLAIGKMRPLETAETAAGERGDLHMASNGTCSRMKATFSVFAMAPNVSCKWRHTQVEPTACNRVK